MGCVEEKKVRKQRPPKGYRLWPEIRREFVHALREVQDKWPKCSELQAIHGAMVMWATASVDDRIRWVNQAPLRRERATAEDMVHVGKSVEVAEQAQRQRRRKAVE